MKPHVREVQQLYERYVDGLEDGSFAFVINEFTFYGWSFVTKKWNPIGKNEPVDLTEIESQLDDLNKKTENLIPLSGTKPKFPVSGDLIFMKNTGFSNEDSSATLKLGFDDKTWQYNNREILNTDNIEGFLSVYAVSDVTGNYNYLTRQDARNDVPPDKRKTYGLIIIYQLDSAEWVIEQYVGHNLDPLIWDIDDSWRNVDSWEHINNNNAHFVEISGVPNIDDLPEGAYKISDLTGFPIDPTKKYYLFQTSERLNLDIKLYQLKIDSNGVSSRSCEFDIVNDTRIWEDWKQLGIPFKIFVEKIGINSIIYPKHFAYNEDLTVKNVILASNAVSASFTVDSINYNEKTLIGITIPSDKDLIINDIDIAVGFDTGSLTILF
ncbi:MAG: hypothetical protein FWD60_04710 [Candidatus Azobacteroides sp.]|nr:hypothetical protein [Candidatus Azobacteroides sp.]